MKTKATHQNRLLKIITMPLKALGKARDFYVRSLMSYAETRNHGSNVVGNPARYGPSSLPRSFSVNPSKSYGESEDLRELIRAASARTLVNRVDIGMLMLQQQQQQQQQQQMLRSQPHKMPPRSCSVGMGRIDEDKPCVFGEETVNVKKPCPRSRSYAGNKKSIVFGSAIHNL